MALTSLKVIGIVLGSIVVLAGAAMLALRTDWGSERLRRQVVAIANEQIQGQLDIGRLSFGGNRLVVWSVALRDPEGQPVAEVARVEVNFRLLPLLKKELRLTAITIEGPHLGLVSDARGSNLSRATAPRKEEPEKPAAKEKEKSTKEGFVVRLDRFDLNGGLVTMARAGDTGIIEKVHLAHLVSFMAVRYATGNGALDLTFRLNGQSTLTPVGGFGLVAEAHAKGDATRFSVNGELLGGTIKAKGDIRSQGLEFSTADVSIAIPKQDLAGFAWGPFRVDGQARPGSIPKVDLALAIPGVELNGKTANAPEFDFKAQLAVADLALTEKAINALAGGEPLSVAGQGHLDLAVGGPMAAAPSKWSTQWSGQFDRLRFAENVISGLSLDGRVAPLTNPPKEVDFKLAIDTVTAGASTLGKIMVEATLQQQAVTAKAQVASPQQTTLTLAGRLDDDRKGFALTGLALAYPQAQWALEKAAQLRFAAETVSLTNLTLRSQQQRLSIEGWKTGGKVDDNAAKVADPAEKKEDVISAHLVVEKLRLDLLPSLAVDPALRLGGTLDVDVKADGEMSNPKVVAQVALNNARFQGFSRLNAKVNATLADQKIAGTLGLEAPFTAVDGRFALPMDPLAPGAPLDVGFDITRLDLSEALRAAAVAAPVDGRITSRMKLTGSADNPKVDVTFNAKDLSLSRPPSAAKTAAIGITKSGEVIDVGQARIHLTYARRTAGADIDFTSSQGDVLKVDANARVDLSYPRVTRGIVVAKIPINGKVVAKDFDVAWISRFSDRLETLAGQVNINAKLDGTVGDPQFLGDVRWKNGKVVATVPKPAPQRAIRQQQ